MASVRLVASVMLPKKICSCLTVEFVELVSLQLVFSYTLVGFRCWKKHKMNYSITGVLVSVSWVSEHK